MQPLALALVVDLILVIVGGVCPYCQKVLPLGGSHLAQAGAALGLGYATAEFLSFF
jgi:hypothetical protein